MRRTYWFIVLAVGMAASSLRAAEPVWSGLADPVVEDIWLRPPAGAKAAKPVWGLAEGLRIGLAPLPGPRGLLRVYTPYVGQPDWRMINFIAIEPIVEGQTRRSYSELERSSLVEGTGKVMWSVDRPDDWTPRNPVHPARGVIGEEDGVRTLTVFIGVEKFHSGAAVFLRLTFRENRPCEVQIATFTQPNSEPLSCCVVTATMGNYARLRRLHLAGGVGPGKRSPNLLGVKQPDPWWHEFRECRTDGTIPIRADLGVRRDYRSADSVCPRREYA